MSDRGKAGMNGQCFSKMSLVVDDEGAISCMEVATHGFLCHVSSELASHNIFLDPLGSLIKVWKFWGYGACGREVGKPRILPHPLFVTMVMGVVCFATRSNGAMDGK